MSLKFVSLPSTDKLNSYVLEILCNQDRLDPEQTTLQQCLLLQSGKPCGILFQVHGPRALKTHAVWAMKEDRILFYDSTGRRFSEVKLCERPAFLQAA